MRAKTKTRSKRAGLSLPVGRIHRILKNGNYAPRIGSGAAVYMTAVLEYLAAEILELSAKAAEDNQRNRYVQFVTLEYYNECRYDHIPICSKVSKVGIKLIILF